MIERFSRSKSKRGESTIKSEKPYVKAIAKFVICVAITIVLIESGSFWYGIANSTTAINQMKTGVNVNHVATEIARVIQNNLLIVIPVVWAAAYFKTIAKAVKYIIKTVKEMIE